MKKYIYLLFIINLYLLPIHSQTRNELGVDTVRIICLYRQVCVQDTLHPQKKTDNLMLLQIGNHCSKYYPFYQYLADSVSHVLGVKANTGQVPSNQEVSDAFKNISIKKVPAGVDFHVFKNYPQKGQLTLSDFFGGENLRYTEALPAMQWKLSNDTMTICGYLCKKATTTFRGRTYSAWYTQEIMVNDGPWKFNGLPGLILKAIDKQRYFSFECTAIETSQKIELIEDFGSDRKLNRQEYNKIKQRYMDNPGAYMSGNPVMQETSPLPAAAYKKRPYNPIERME